MRKNKMNNNDKEKRKEKKVINIGLNGIDYNFGNLGCQALAYSLIKILQSESKKIGVKLNYYLYFYKKNENEIKKISKIFDINIENINVVVMKLKNLNNTINVIKKYKCCDLIIDMSGGDSFSDIYGVKRLIKESFYKEVAIRNNIPLILGPQTYGPYNRKISKVIARNVLNKADIVCTRDEDSVEVIKKISKIEPSVCTDIALRLPYNKQNSLKEESIGINVSALMWYNEYNIDIKIDYKKYIDRLINYLKDNTEYNIYLVSHVNADSIENENDYLLCSKLALKYDVKVAPKFADPIEAKSFISELNVFIGSRMHATIAAFSSNVPTIPVAYSKKFEGLYKSLNYNYYIDAKKENTESAIQKTIDYIKNIEKIKDAETKSLKIAQDKLKTFDQKISDLLKKFIV